MFAKGFSESLAGVLTITVTLSFVIAPILSFFLPESFTQQTKNPVIQIEGASFMLPPLWKQSPRPGCEGSCGDLIRPNENEFNSLYYIYGYVQYPPTPFPEDDVVQIARGFGIATLSHSPRHAQLVAVHPCKKEAGYQLVLSIETKHIQNHDVELLWDVARSLTFTDLNCLESETP
ncbi:MAG TPA: hypothetical protein VJJ72_02860 [Candidatus Paceibacterota bacterium]